MADTEAPPEKNDVEKTDATVSVLSNLKDNIINSGEGMEAVVESNISLSRYEVTGGHALELPPTAELKSVKYGPKGSPSEHVDLLAKVKEMIEKGEKIEDIDAAFEKGFEGESICIVEFLKKEVEPEKQDKNTEVDTESKPDAAVEPPENTEEAEEAQTEEVEAAEPEKVEESEPEKLEESEPAKGEQQAENTENAEAPPEVTDAKEALEKVSQENVHDTLETEATNEIEKAQENPEDVVETNNTNDDTIETAVADTENDEVAEVNEPQELVSVDIKQEEVVEPEKQQEEPELSPEELKLREARQQFTKFDTNGDGVLDTEELLGVIEWIWNSRPAASTLTKNQKYKQASDLMIECDKNRDGTMCWDEFQLWYSDIATRIDSYHETFLACQKKELEEESVEKKRQKIIVATSNRQTKEEQQFMKDMESKGINDSFYSSLLQQSQALVDTDKLEWKIREMTEHVIDLKTKLQKAEARCETAQQESSIRDKTIRALQEASTKYLQDRDSASTHLKLKAEQVTSLKDSVKNLRSSLEEILNEKNGLNEQLEESRSRFATLESENTKIREFYEASLNDLKQLPEYKALQNAIKEKDILLEEEKQSRVAALDAWDKSQKTWKQDEAKMIEEKEQLEIALKGLENEKTELTRSVTWFQEETARMDTKMKQMMEDHQSRAEEITQLRIKMGSVETEIKANAELEKLKSQIMIESMQNEIRWREKLHKSQASSLQKQLDTALLDKLKLQKQFNQFEAAIQEAERHDPMHQGYPMPPQNGGNRIPTPRNKRILMKHRYLELESIDQEIAKLKGEMAARDRGRVEKYDVEVVSNNGLRTSETLPPIYNYPQQVQAEPMPMQHDPMYPPHQEFHKAPTQSYYDQFQNPNTSEPAKQPSSTRRNVRKKKRARAKGWH